MLDVQRRVVRGQSKLHRKGVAPRVGVFKMFSLGKGKGLASWVSLLSQASCVVAGSVICLGR